MKRAWGSVSLGALATALALAGGGCASGWTNPGERAEDRELLRQEREMIQLVNAYRGTHALGPLRVNVQLCRAARRHAANMAARGRMNHRLDGRGPGDRARAEGFRGPVAENLAAGTEGNPGVAFALWTKSAGHRSNVLDANASEIGVGFARREDGGNDYWVVMFGALP